MSRCEGSCRFMQRRCGYQGCDTSIDKLRLNSHRRRGRWAWRAEAVADVVALTPTSSRWTSSGAVTNQASRSTAMNRYGATARNYFRDYLPTRYAQIENPEEFFQDL